jgi:tetratricopeptide (TPR) repeat protein
MIRRIAIWFFLSASLAWADENSDRLTVAGVREFTAAYQAWDGTRFGVAAELFRQASTNATATVTNFYWLGAAQFHRLLQLQNPSANPTNPPAADAALEAAVDALTTAVKLDEHHAESHALLATLYGMKINGSVLRAAWYGPRVMKHQNQAIEFGATNPRVRYLLGMCRFHTAKKPAAWQETLTTLLAAEKLFEAESKVAAAPLEPRWGHDSCLTFIGRTYETLGQPPEAADYFRKALEKHPQDSLAQAGLKRVTEKK